MYHILCVFTKLLIIIVIIITIIITIIVIIIIIIIIIIILSRAKLDSFAIYKSVFIYLLAISYVYSFTNFIT